jgi:hypothetical protein
VEYPKPRYDGVIVMHPDRFVWTPSRDERGVGHKALASLTERETTVGFVRYESGAQHRVHGLASPELHFVLTGTLRAGDGVYPRWTAFKFEPGDDHCLEAVEATETYVISLPVFD